MPALTAAAPAAPEPHEPGKGGPGPRRGGPLGSALASRGVRWGTATGVYVAVVVAVLVAVNLVGARIPTSFDLTAHHKLTLTAASKQILRDLQRPVQITAFEQPGDPTGGQVRVLLGQYAAAGHGLITYAVVDPAADRALAIKDNITNYGTVVVASGSTSETVQASDMTTYTNSGSAVFDGEGPITNAIIRAASPVQLTVDFLAGDGEPDITQNTIPDAVQALKDQGYTVDSLNLLTSNGVPTDLAALVVVSPQKDLSTAAITALQHYADQGGHLLFLLNPVLQPFANLDGLLKKWSITPQNDLVLDGPRHYQTDLTSVAPEYGNSPIVAPIQQANMATLLIGAQGLTVGTAPAGYTLSPVLTTSPGTSAGSQASYGITDLGSLSSTSSLQYRAGKDIPGPLTLAVSIVKDLATSTAGTATATPAATAAAGIGQKQFRAVVIGNATFIASSSTGQANGPINVQGNKDLFLNALGWLTGRSQGIAVRPHAALNTQVFLTSATTHALIDTFIFGIPLLCFALGFGTWWSRRRL